MKMLNYNFHIYPTWVLIPFECILPHYKLLEPKATITYEAHHLWTTSTNDVMFFQ